MVNLFSYGSLRQPEVQRATFGRLLDGAPDAALGFALSRVTVTDAEVIRISGTAEHTILRTTGDPADRVAGTRFAITEAELAAADAYEPEGYARFAVRLELGAEAFLYAKP